MIGNATDLHSIGPSLGVERNHALQVAAIVACLAGDMAGHWLLPTTPHAMHTLHVVLQMLLILPAVLAAAWYGFRGALVTVFLTTAVYLPHVLLQWRGDPQENVNQYAALATIWFTAILAGILMDREKVAIRVLAATHEGALIAMVSALDAREHNTQLHSRRVQAYATRLGEAVGMSGKDLAILGEGALLHDIGKIGVPDDILLKAGPLTAEEWIAMRTHPETGRRILASVPFLKRAAEVVVAHHEKYDGSGYPRGLSGERIPMGARVFAVVDVLDALTTDRPYRKAMSFDTAREEIKRESGTHFDPALVEGLLSIAEEEWQRIAAKVAASADCPPDSPRDLGIREGTRLGVKV